MSTAVVFPTQELGKIIGQQRVYIRRRWSDPWQLVGELFCDEAVWCCGPSMPTASLRWHYGEICPPGSVTFTEVLKETDWALLYVLITFDIEPQGDPSGPWDYRAWTGVIEVSLDEFWGAVPRGGQIIASGVQTFVAYGMERLLDTHRVEGSWFEFVIPNTSTWAPRFTTKALSFNLDERNGKLTNNRTKNKIQGEHIFASNEETNEREYWSSLNIVEYLLRFQTPLDASGIRNVEFELKAPHVLPDWDHPQLEASGTKTLALLQRIIARQRFLGYYFFANPSSNRVELRTFSFATQPIFLPNNPAPIPENFIPVTLRFDADQTAAGAMKITSIDTVHQVVVRGAKRRSVFTLSAEDDTLSVDWEGGQQDAYEKGASLDPSYPAPARVAARQYYNNQVRTKEELYDVFRRFRIGWRWNGKVKDGLDGPTEHPVFPVLDDNGDVLPDSFPQHEFSLSLDQSLPLQVDVDYSFDAIEQGVLNEDWSYLYKLDEERPPFGVLAVPDAATPRYIIADTWGLSANFGVNPQPANHDFTLTLQVVENSRAFYLHVVGAPQHAIAFGEFIPLPDDWVFGQCDYRDALFTVSVTEDRYAEGRWPPDSQLPTNVDFVRRLVFYAGDGFRQDYVVPETVVDVDAFGNLVRSEGGFIHDSTAELEGMAQLVWQWAGYFRRVLELESDQWRPFLELGQMVVEISQQDSDGVGGHHTTDIGTVITEIRVNSSLGTSENPPIAPRWRLCTQAGELDPMRLSLEAEAPAK